MRATAQDAVPLETGFTPDPIWLEGQTRGERPINEIATGCRGYVGGQPDHVLSFETRFLFLRLFAVSTGAVTLAIRGPDGAWHCSGQPLDGAPREQGRFEPGRYEVWVGSRQPSEHLDYRVAITEMRTVSPSMGQAQEAGQVSGEAGLQVEAERGRFRDRRLLHGFLPDPQMDHGTAEGTISTISLGARCRGFVLPQPSHVLTLRDDFDYFRVHLRIEQPAVLIVRTPDGRYLCSAPDGRVPVVDQERWPTGRYLIWVGPRTQGATSEYDIVYTETRDD